MEENHQGWVMIWVAGEGMWRSSLGGVNIPLRQFWRGGQVHEKTSRSLKWLGCSEVQCQSSAHLTVSNTKAGAHSSC